MQTTDEPTRTHHSLWKRTAVILGVFLAVMAAAVTPALANPNPPPPQYETYQMTFEGPNSLSQCTAQVITGIVGGLWDDGYCWETVPGVFTELWADII